MTRNRALHILSEEEVRQRLDIDTPDRQGFLRYILAGMRIGKEYRGVDLLNLWGAYKNGYDEALERRADG